MTLFAVALPPQRYLRSPSAQLSGRDLSSMVVVLMLAWLTGVDEACESLRCCSPGLVLRARQLPPRRCLRPSLARLSGQGLSDVLVVLMCVDGAVMVR